MSEQPRAARSEKRYAVQCVPSRSPVREEHEGVTLNVSPRGVGIRGDTTFPVGTLLNLLVHPIGEEPMALTGAVMWCDPASGRMGVRLQNQDERYLGFVNRVAAANRARELAEAMELEDTTPSTALPPISFAPTLRFEKSAGPPPEAPPPAPPSVPPNISPGDTLRGLPNSALADDDWAPLDPADSRPPAVAPLWESVLPAEPPAPEAVAALEMPAKSATEWPGITRETVSGPMGDWPEGLRMSRFDEPLPLRVGVGAYLETKGFLDNISRSGLRLTCAESYPPGTLLRVAVTLPEGEIARVEAYVVWSRVATEGRDGADLGLRIHRTDDVFERLLTETEQRAG